ncbi:MAG: sec-independent protein translocase protein TatB [Gammaproteobacteria bacterium]|jgi:sec-independent protein translocase protein TatB
MFDISFLEISVICVITLLVVGPERLPGLIRDVSRVVRKLRRIVTQTRYELERDFNFEEERKKLQTDLKKDSEGLTGAIDELDDLMKVAPDKIDDEGRPTTNTIKDESAETDKPNSNLSEKTANKDKLLSQ